MSTLTISLAADRFPACQQQRKSPAEGSPQMFLFPLPGNPNPTVQVHSPADTRWFLSPQTDSPPAAAPWYHIMGCNRRKVCNVFQSPHHENKTQLCSFLSWF